MLQHSNVLASCKRIDIQALAEECDNEYYLSALGPGSGDRHRAERGRSSIENAIKAFTALNDQVSCTACQEEIGQQIDIQKAALQEIDCAWEFE